MEKQPDTPSSRLAVAALVLATLAFGAVGLVTSVLGGTGGVMASPAVVTALATFCVLFPDTRGFGLLLTWNALGLGVGLLGLGLLSVGAMMVVPVVVVAFALSAWPRPVGTSIVTLPGQVALVGGATVVLGLALVTHLWPGLQA
jgi:hypothetical protein